MSLRTESLALAAFGMIALLYPRVPLGFTTPEPFEVEIMRWAGLAVLGLAAIRPWAIRSGGGPTRRMRRWTAVAVLAGILNVLTTNPLFLIVLFSAVVGAVLDATVQRATTAAYDLLARLQAEEA